MRHALQPFVIAALALPMMACQSVANDSGAQASAAQDDMNDPHREGRHSMDHPLDRQVVGVDAEGMVVDLQGREVGTIYVSGGPHGTLLRVDANGLGHGFHGFHLHEAGLCEPETGFTSAGAHIDPDGKDHGLFEEDGPHVGDLSNVYAHQDGHVRTDVFASGTRLEDIMDEDGFSVMFHENGDDYTTQPGGTTGDRVACAAFPAG